MTISIWGIDHGVEISKAKRGFADRSGQTATAVGGAGAGLYGGAKVAQGGTRLSAGLNSGVKAGKAASALGVPKMGAAKLGAKFGTKVAGSQGMSAIIRGKSSMKALHGGMAAGAATGLAAGAAGWRKMRNSQQS